MKLIVSVLGVLIILIVVTLSYYGLFTRVSITEKDMGGFWLLYEQHVGAYKEVGPVMDKIYSPCWVKMPLRLQEDLVCITMILRKLRKRT